MTCFHETLSILSSDPLFSIIITLYTLILLYFPSIFLRLVLSPVVFSSFILFIFLLLVAEKKTNIHKKEIRKESNVTVDCSVQLPEQQSPDLTDTGSEADTQQNESRRESNVVKDRLVQSETDPHGSGSGSRQTVKEDTFYEDAFVEWDVRAPLEVIYEEYDEGEEADDEDDDVMESRDAGIERYASLSLFYPESDSDTSSGREFPAIMEWDSPENMWINEDDGEGLIEIALDGKRNSEVDEENLIEIDLFPAR